MLGVYPEFIEGKSNQNLKVSLAGIKLKDTCGW